MYVAHILLGRLRRFGLDVTHFERYNTYVFDYVSKNPSKPKMRKQLNEKCINL